MATLTIRNIPEALHKALRARASRHDHSMQAEAREILECAVMQQGRLKPASLLADISREARRVDAKPSLMAPVDRRTQSTRPGRSR